MRSNWSAATRTCQAKKRLSWCVWMWIYTPRHASAAFPLADRRRDSDVADGGSLAHFDGLLRLAEEVLDGGDLLGGDCSGLSAEGVADEEAEVCLCA